MACTGERIKVVVDTREKVPWEFDAALFEIVHAGLPAGDYSLAGLEDRLAIERKSLGDFVGTVIGQWLRFRKELNRLSGYDCAAIAIEANLEQIFEHRYESEATPASILGRMNAIFLETGIPCFLCGPRLQAAEMAARFLTLASKKLR
jgi:ERCC4-type nuclease